MKIKNVKSVKCYTCKDRSWRKCCDKRLDSLFECYICKGYFKNRYYIIHMNMHHNDPDLYLTCIMCNVNQQFSGLRFKVFKFRLCIYLHRYRYTHTINRLKEYAENFNIKVFS